jgi:acetylornithine deacetylase/succinyl-diaminopimelate desuccinylase-like protein
MITTVADALPAPHGPVLHQVLNPRLADRILDVLGSRVAAFDPLLHNTAAATIIRGGEKGNVLPSEITVDLDCRLLPGFSTETLLRELQHVVGRDAELEVVAFDANPAEKPDMALFDMLACILREADPEGIPTPYLLSGVTDGRFFSRLGIQTYGFLPMRLPADLPFSALIHAADERIPVDAPAFGANAIYQALQRFGPAR